MVVQEQHKAAAAAAVLARSAQTARPVSVVLAAQELQPLLQEPRQPVPTSLAIMRLLAEVEARECQHKAPEVLAAGGQRLVLATME
jgi:hypothetical protein